MVLTELLKLSDAYQIGIENLMNEDGIKIVRKGEQFAEYSLHKGIIIRYAWKPHTLDEYVAAIEADDRLTPAFKKQREKLNKADFTAVKRFYERWKVSAVPETAKYTAVFGASYSGEGGDQYLYAIEVA